MKPRLLILWIIALVAVIANGAIIHQTLIDARGLFWSTDKYSNGELLMVASFYSVGVLFISIFAAVFFALFPFKGKDFRGRFKFWWPVLTIALSVLYMAIFVALGG